MPAKKTKKRKLVVGNWKMNPTSLEEARRIYNAVKARAKKLTNTDVVVCPPAIYAGVLKPGIVRLGVQDVHFEERGSFTGEISVPMTRSLGAEYVIVGHSERRKAGETDEMVARKANAVLGDDLIAIVCVGENEHDAQGDYLEFLKNQIRNSLNKIQKKYLKKLIIAYEPVWAVGAAEAMTPRDLYETSIFVKKTLADIFGQEEAMRVPILYGGAVTFRNARDIVAGGEVDGLLVGRESVNPPGFIEILKVIDEI